MHYEKINQGYPVNIQGYVLAYECLRTKVYTEMGANLWLTRSNTENVLS